MGGKRFGKEKERWTERTQSEQQDGGMRPEREREGERGRERRGLKS